MARKGVRRELNCPIDFALGIFGDRWTLLVIRDLLFHGKRRFGELIASQEGIASNILSARLKKLDRQGLISRKMDTSDRRQAIYELTEKGLGLVPVLIEVIQWSGKYDPDSAAPKSFLKRAARDREQLAGEIRATAKQRRLFFVDS